MALLDVMLQFHVILYIPQLLLYTFYIFFVYWYCFEVLWVVCVENKRNADAVQLVSQQELYLII